MAPRTTASAPRAPASKRCRPPTLAGKRGRGSPSYRHSSIGRLDADTSPMRTTRVWRNRGAVAVVAASLLVGLGMQGAQAAGRTVTKRTPAPGVVYETI